MSETADQPGARFVFRMTEDEAAAFRRYLVKNQRRYVDRRLTIGIPMAAFAGVLLATGIAYYRGLLSLSAALLVELGFVAGYFGLLIAVLTSSRRLFRTMHGKTRSAQVSWDCRFDDTGIFIKMGALETRMTWDAIVSVQDEGPIVAFWYDPIHGFFIPARLFTDAAARNAFAAWASEHVRLAAPGTEQAP